MDDGVALIHELGLLRLAMAVALQEVVARRVEKALKGIDLEFEQGAFEHIALAVDAHVAAGFHLVGRLGVFDAVRPDHRAGLA